MECKSHLYVTIQLKIVIFRVGINSEMECVHLCRKIRKYIRGDFYFDNFTLILH